MSQSASKYFIVSVCLIMQYYLNTDKSTIKLMILWFCSWKSPNIFLKIKKDIMLDFFIYLYSYTRRLMNKKATIFLLLIAVVFLNNSCRKELEKPSWDVDMLVPLLKSTLSVENIVADSLLQTNPDNSLKLVYHNPICDFDLDNMLEVQDTTITTSYSIPFGSLALSPGQTLINNSEETSYSFNGAALSYCIIKKGYCNFEVHSDIKEIIEVTYSIPKATKNNQPFKITVLVPAAANGAGNYTGSFDLSGYEIDLKGFSGNKVNTIGTTVIAKISSDGNSVVVVPGENLTIRNSFTELSLYYAKGYFGNNKFPIGPAMTAFTVFDRIVGGTIQLENVSLNLSISNGIGVDARLLINNLKSVNTNANNKVVLNQYSSGISSNSIIGTSFNINRSIDHLFQPVEVTPSDFSVLFDNSNSNIKSFLENFPNYIEYEIETEINPYGNLSGGNDFINTNYGLNVSLDMEMPLSFIANNLSLQDTIEFNAIAIPNIDKIRDGTLTLFADNGFPFDAKIQFFMLDDQNTIIDSLFFINTIGAGVVNNNFKVENKKTSKLLIPVSENKMSRFVLTKKMLVKVSFNTNPANQYLKIYGDYTIDFKLVGDFNYII